MSLIEYCSTVSFLIATIGCWCKLHIFFFPVMTCWKWTSQAELLSSLHYQKAKISNITAHEFKWFRAGWLVYKVFLVVFSLTFSYLGMENLALRTTNKSIYECVYRSPWLWSSHCQPLLTLAWMCSPYLDVFWVQWSTSCPFCGNFEPRNWGYNGKSSLPLSLSGGGCTVYNCWILEPFQLTNWWIFPSIKKETDELYLSTRLNAVCRCNYFGSVNNLWTVYART